MSSTILTVIVLVVMWLVVLVPMFVRRGDEPDEPDATIGDGLDGREVVDDDVDDAVDGFDDGDVDTGADPTPDWVPARSAVGHGLATTRSSGAAPEQADQTPPRSTPSGRARMLARRRRALALLIGLTLVTLLIVLFARGRPGAWVVQVGCDLLLVGYLIGLRREARQERMRRAMRMARAAAARAEARTRRTVRAARISRTPRTARTTRGTGYRGPQLDPHPDSEPDDPAQRRVV